LAALVSELPQGLLEEFRGMVEGATGLLPQKLKLLTKVIHIAKNFFYVQLEIYCHHALNC
jgi:hypothetical protein